MRKHMAWYMKGLPGAAELRGKLNYAETMAEMKALLHEYLKGSSVNLGSLWEILLRNFLRRVF